MVRVELPSDRRELREHIVDAAARLLREGGAGALTTRGVAEASGVQAPTIYRLFGDKEGLVDAVAEHVMSIHVAAKVSATYDDDPVAALRSAWQTHIDFGLANAELYGLLIAPGRASVSPATAAGMEVLRARIRNVAVAGILRVSEQLAVDLVHAAGTGAVLALLEAPAERRDYSLSDVMLDAVLSRILDDSTQPELAAGPAVAAITFAPHVPQLPGLSDAERSVLAEWMRRSIAATPAPQPRF